VQERVERKISFCMIDKSKAEMAALRTREIYFLLCLFHVLQEWQRFVRSGEGEINAVSAATMYKAPVHCTHDAVRTLAHEAAPVICCRT
jgi:hypothetical protein